ncbi:MAG: cysteine desulfurase family protein [Patescibacteria group bacterium]
MSEKKRIYLDNAAATPVREEVKKAMERFWNIDFGNAGAIHQEGQIAKQAIIQSRETIAKILKARSEEIIFTSSGTESNNLAVFGALDKLEEQGMKIKDMHLITTAIEHPSVLYRFQNYQKKGARLDFAKIEKNGIINLKHFKKLLQPNTVLVSIMFVNNEIGTIQPIAEIVKIIRDFKKKRGDKNSILPIFHSDAAQALLYIPINTENLGADLLSFDAQKIYGPKGIGLLYIRKEIKINPLIIGGSQEKGMRPGTENIPLIVGFAKALELAIAEQKKEVARLTKLRDYFITQVLEKIPASELNGDAVCRLPNNVNISLRGINNEFVVLQLDAKGIACSTKSACLTKKHSYVIEALGDKDREKTNNSLRFALGRQTSKKDIDYVIQCLVKICNK